MTPKEYESLRNELIRLLQKAVALDSVNQKTREILSQISRKTQENQFDIVLVGEFQGGKSTTFDALCDGREISPTGSGIKTSGCIISAQNISDPDEPEKATVEWRNTEELIAGFSDLLLPHLQSLDKKRFGNITATELTQIMNLDNPADCQLLAKAVNQEWQIWEADKSGYDHDQRGNLDILRAASIIAHNSPHEALKQFRQKNEFNISEIGKMVVFPQDWESRWKKNEPEKFTLEEILFIFIKRVRLRLHSENLGRLGCVIVDCPGLFASRWDMEIARSAMFDADAILYLFEGSRSMRLPDLKALQFVKKNGMENKLFYGCNMRGHTLADSEKILQATVTMLRNNGFRVQDGDMALYHALIGLRAVQGECLYSGKSDNISVNKKKLHKDLTRQIMLLDIDDDEFTGGYESSLQFAHHVSGLERLTGMVENTVVKRKARAILIDNGAQIAADCLMEIEENSHNREIGATKKEEEFKEYIRVSEEKLKKFEDACFRFVEKLDDEGPDYILAEDMWRGFKNRRERLYDNIAGRLYKEIHAFFKREKIESKIGAIIREEIDNTLCETINVWTSEIKEGNNTHYNNQMSKIVRSVSNDLKRIWHESGLPEENLLKGIVITEFSGNPGIDDERLFLQLYKNKMIEAVKPLPFEKLRSFAGLYTAASLASLSGLYTASIFLIPGFTAVIPLLVAILIEGIILIKVRTNHTEIREKVKTTIRNKLDPLFYEIEEEVKSRFRYFVKSEIRERYKNAFLKIIKNPRVVFEERIKQAEADFKKSRQEREAIAREAKQIRETQIQPLRMNLQNFVFKVEHYLGKENR